MRLRAAVGAAGPMVLTVGVLAPVARPLHLGAAVPVVGASLAITQARFDRRGRARALVRLARVPVVLVVLTLVGSLLLRARPVGDAVVVLIVFGALEARRHGPRAAMLGRALLVPLIALFVTPVPHGQGPARTFLVLLVAGMVAALADVVVQRLLGPPVPTTAALRRALRRGRGVGPAARALDALLPPGDARARSAVLAVEAAADDGSDPDPALARLEAALADPAPQPEPQPTAAPERPRSSRRIDGRTRLALQSALAVAAALVVGQTVFGEHWPWTVVTALTLTVAARSRGDVALRGTERLAGAAAGTVSATLLAHELAGHRVASVVVMLVVLTVGVVLRDVHYAVWAFCLTSVLGLLMGFLGQTSGAEVLGERVLAVVASGVCALVPAFLVLPVRTRDSARKRAAEWRRAVQALLELPPGDAAGAATARRIEALAEDLRTAVRPLALAQGRPEREWAAVASAAGPRARAHVLGAPGAKGDLRRAAGSIGMSLRDTKR